MHAKRLLHCVTLLLLVLRPSAPRAEQDPAMTHSLRLFKKGRSHFQAGHYEQAIHTLQQAQQLYRHRNNLYYIAASYRRLGKLRRSFAVYADYAATFAEPIKRNALLRRYERKLRDEPPCVLSLGGTPAGAEVLLDGFVAGKLPFDKAVLRLTVVGGPHKVELRAPAHQSAHWALRAEFGEQQHRTIALTRRAPSPVAGPPRPVLAPVARPPVAHTQVPHTLVARGRGGFFIEASVGPSHRRYGLDTYAAWGLDASAAGGYLWSTEGLGLRLFGELSYATADATGYGGLFGVLGGAGARVYPTQRLWLELGLGLGAALLIDAAPGVFFFHQEGKAVVAVEGSFALLCVSPSFGLGFELWRGLSAGLRATLYHSPSIAEFRDGLTGITRFKLALSLGWIFR